VKFLAGSSAGIVVAAWGEEWVIIVPSMLNVSRNLLIGPGAFTSFTSCLDATLSTSSGVAQVARTKAPLKVVSTFDTKRGALLPEISRAAKIAGRG